MSSLCCMVPGSTSAPCCESCCVSARAELHSKIPVNAAQHRVEVTSHVPVEFAAHCQMQIRSGRRSSEKLLVVARDWEGERLLSARSCDGAAGNRRPGGRK